jgi:hypothetical protein
MPSLTIQPRVCRILAVVSHHAQKGVIGLEDAAVDSQMMIPMMLESTRRRIFLSVARFEIAVELDVLLGGFSPPFRLQPRQRHPCEAVTMTTAAAMSPDLRCSSASLRFSRIGEERHDRRRRHRQCRDQGIARRKSAEAIQVAFRGEISGLLR